MTEEESVEAELAAAIAAEVERGEQIVAGLRLYKVDDDAIAAFALVTEPLTLNAVEYQIWHCGERADGVRDAADDDERIMRVAQWTAAASALHVMVAAITGQPDAAAGWFTAWLKDAIGAGSA